MPQSAAAFGRAEPEEGRRRHLIETTIDTLAEQGFVGTTLARIAARGGISAALLVHYFGDKDRLLEAAFRTLAARLSSGVASRLRAARTPRERVQAVIDANLAPEEFTPRVGAVWLAFWGQVVHAPRLKRVQAVYQQRMLSNLRHALRAVKPEAEARQLAGAIAALIDGVWLRAALSEWREADSEAARRMVATMVDRSFPEEAPMPDANRAAPHLVTNWIDGRAMPGGGARFETRNPATGEILAEVDGRRASRTSNRRWPPPRARKAHGPR